MMRAYLQVLIKTPLVGFASCAIILLLARAGPGAQTVFFHIFVIAIIDFSLTAEEKNI